MPVVPGQPVSLAPARPAWRRNRFPVLALGAQFGWMEGVLYSPHFRFLFVHIPKTGGTSLRAALKPLLYRDPWYWLMWYPQRLSHWTGHRTVTKFPRHARIIAAREMLPPEIFNQLFKFSVVRNPWDMQVSSFHHLHKEHPEAVEGLKDFKDFIRHKLDPDRPPNPHLDVSAISQIDFLRDLDGRVLVDDLVRFESLHTDYERVVSKIGLKNPPPLPHKRKGRRKADYREYYDAATAQLVADRYRADIETFGYTFDPPGGSS